MKVSQLIAELSELDPDTVVLQSSDPEGNEIMELDEVELSMAHRNSYGEIELVHPIDQDEYDEGMLQPCVVLWP